MYHNDFILLTAPYFNVRIVFVHVYTPRYISMFIVFWTSCHKWPYIPYTSQLWTPFPPSGQCALLKAYHKLYIYGASCDTQLSQMNEAVSGHKNDFWSNARFYFQGQTQ